MESLNTEVRNTNDDDIESPYKNARPRLHISQARLTPASIPTLAEAKILACLPDKVFSMRVNPNWKVLHDSGVPVREWTYYHETVERFERVRVGEQLVSVCYADYGGHEKPVGMVVMSFPGKREDRTWIDWILGDYVYPTMKALGFAEKGLSLDRIFLGLFFKTAEETRKQLMKEREYVTIDELFTDPASHGIGAGSLLIDHCITLATSKKLPILLESSKSAFKFYKKRGFEQIGEGSFVYKGEDVRWPVMLRECGHED